MEEANASDFEEKTKQGLVVVDFWAPWCGPCKMMGPVLEEVSQKMDNARFVKVNVDDNQELAGKFGISSIPTLVLFKNGEEAERRSGFIPGEELQSWIAEKA